MARPEIFLGDLLRGISKLRISDPATASTVLRMLSLDRLEASAATSLPGAFAPAATTPQAPGPAETPVPVAPRAEPAVPVLTAAREAVLRPLPRAAAQTSAPAWSLSAARVGRPAVPVPPAQRIDPLFPSRQTRGLLTAALASWSADGPLDIPRIVDTLAEGGGLTQLPFEMTATVRRGVQLLIDTSMAMSPYRLDVEQLLNQIGSLVASDQSQVHYFSICPSRGLAAAAATDLTPWQAPPRGTPVFIVTDLGIGRAPDTEEPAGDAEWLGFARAVREAGCVLTALVPYGPTRWPRPLTRVIRIIHWDRRTTAAIVRRGLVAAARIGR